MFIPFPVWSRYRNGLHSIPINTSGRGLDIYDGHAYVVDITDRQTYVYNVSTGARDTTKEFAFGTFAAAVQAIVVTDDRVIFLDSTDDMLYFFEHDGARVRAEDTDISPFSGTGRGLAINRANIFVGDFTNDIAYALTLAGVRDADDDVTLDPTDNPSVQGLSASDTRLYSIDSAEDRINVYDVTKSESITGHYQWRFDNLTRS